MEDPIDAVEEKGEVKKINELATELLKYLDSCSEYSLVEKHSALESAMGTIRSVITAKSMAAFFAQSLAAIK